MKLSSIYYLHEIGGKKNQEDYIWPAPGTAAPENKIFIVCDGVGGAENGEVASRLVAEYIGNTLLKTPEANISTAYINQLLAAAKESLVTHAKTAGLNKDLATTFSLLMLFSSKAFIAWCGDSRVYHIRNGNILYKTADHSLVNTLVKSGEITEEEALSHPQKNVILKAITGDETVSEAEGEWIEDIAGGDYFLLCTDGLLENITDAYLTELLSAKTLPNIDIAAAIQEKCLGKTRDNYSMYLLQLDPATVPEQEIKKNTGFLWLILLLLATVAAAFLYFDRDAEKASLPAAAASLDSVKTLKADSTRKTDSVFQPGKSVVVDSELNKEEPEEKKIVPAPLPETKPVADSATHKKRNRRPVTDTVFVNPHTLIKTNQTDSLAKGKTIN